jgi:hypothetical protein
MQTKAPMLIQDDCISVSTSTSKQSYMGNCELILKSGEIYYPNAVNPGDWVAVWMADDQEHIDAIAASIRSGVKTNKSGSSIVNNFESGLKFIGRVANVGMSEQISESGTRSLTQRVSCSSFTELSSTVYFTFAASMMFELQPNNTAPDLRTVKNLGQPRFKDLSKNFFDLLTKQLIGRDDGVGPDFVIKYLFIWLMGITKSESVNTAFNYKGSYNDAIFIPPIVAKLVGVKTSSKIPVYQYYSMLLGLQKYASSGEVNEHEAPKAFAPTLPKASPSNNIMETGNKLKGSIEFKPPFWAQVDYWSIFNQYLNGLINEMYTTLRCDQFNRIRPTVVVREQPFSTGLFNTLHNPAFQSEIKKATPKKTKKGKVASTQLKADIPFSPKGVNAIRQHYNNLPRWVIDASMVKNFNFLTDERERVNFVQVFTQNRSMAQLNQSETANDHARKTQFDIGNYRVDLRDIERNGLRARVLETIFDTVMPANSQAPYWAQIKADHLFNGHLRPYGSLTLNGIQEPICVGDNLEYRGIVFHINSVSHSAQISSNGRKSFQTSISFDHGIMATSLDNNNQIPVYPSLERGSSYIVQDDVVPADDVEFHRKDRQ